MEDDQGSPSNSSTSITEIRTIPNSSAVGDIYLSPSRDIQSFTGRLTRNTRDRKGRPAVFNPGLHCRSLYNLLGGMEHVSGVKELDKVINVLESITGDPEHRIGDAQLAGLSQDCIELSRLECFLPGAYIAASALLEGIQAARLRSKSVAQQRMLTAVELLRSLPLRD